MGRLLCLVLLGIVLAGPSAWAGEPVMRRPPIYRVTPVPGGRYLLEPLAPADGQPVNSQPNPNLPAAGSGGGQPHNPKATAGRASSGSPATAKPGF